MGVPGWVMWLSGWTYASVLTQRVDVEAKKRFKKGSPEHEYLAFFVLLPLLLSPFLISSAQGGWRGFMAMAAWFYSFRASQTFLEKRFKSEPLFYRGMHVGATFHDLRLCKRDIPDARRREIYLESGMELFVNSIGIAIAVALLRARWALPRPLSFAVGTLAGGTYAMLSLNAFGAILSLMSAPAGIELPRLMHSPQRSLSLAEFWGVRWDTVIQEILASYVYKPLRDDRSNTRYKAPRSAAVLATFVASGFIHVWPLFCAGMPVAQSLMMMSYFVSQCLLLFVEDAIAQKDWKDETARWTWTAVCTILPLPLVVAPTLALMGSQL